MMQFRISDSFARLRPSIIRELLKQMANPSMISFAGGSPAPESFPVEEIRRFSDELLRQEPTQTLQYSVTEGVPALRRAVKEFANRSAEVCSLQDDVLITAGSQQGLDLTARCLCNAGDLVAVEDPCFLSAHLTFRSMGAQLVGVPVQKDGVDLDRLEEVLSAERKPAFFYCIPNFQNPTGRCMSMEKRRAVYEMTEHYGVPVLEDDPYGALSFGQCAPLPIKALGKARHIIYAGSFSKILCPGMRLAYCIADRELVQVMVTAKQCSDVHTNVWAQRVCERILTQTDLSGHLVQLGRLYARKAEKMMSELERLCPMLEYEAPQGGMFLWLTLPSAYCMPEFVRRCLEQGVAVVPGNVFYTDDQAVCQSVRVSFSTPTHRQIEQGVEVMARVIKQMA